MNPTPEETHPCDGGFTTLCPNPATHRDVCSISSEAVTVWHCDEHHWPARPVVYAFWPFAVTPVAA